MNLFSTFSTAGSGLKVMRTWLDAVGDNIANMNNVARSGEPAFQERIIVAEATDYGAAGQPGITAGSRVGAVLYGPAEGRAVYDPQHPFADDQGLVRFPDIDLGEQMTSLIVAQRAYQANLAVVERARDAYQQALQIGK